MTEERKVVYLSIFDDPTLWKGPTEERRLRELLAKCYSGLSLYTDDGELQDNRDYPLIDFLRDPANVIEAKMLQRELEND